MGACCFVTLGASKEQPYTRVAMAKEPKITEEIFRASLKLLLIECIKITTPSFKTGETVLKLRNYVKY
jgi:hypothetical protein